MADKHDDVPYAPARTQSLKPTTLEKKGKSKGAKNKDGSKLSTVLTRTFVILTCVAVEGL